jgi:ribosomal protein S18 acetylase RimI-like enzyme
MSGADPWGVEDTRDWWRWTNLDESWIAEVDGEAAAFGALLDRGEHAAYFASVDPRYGGRGISTTLLRRAEQRARELGSPKLTAGMFSENTAARRLLERLGFWEVRRFYHMQIDFDSPRRPPNAPTASLFRRSGRRMRTRSTGRWRKRWPTTGDTSTVGFDEWKRRRLEAPETDVSLWFIARSGDEIAGVLRGDARQHGGGWIGMLGVRPAWRRRGIANALLRHAFAEYHRRGEPHVGLGVDTQNPSGATRLYERAGMRVTTENVVFEKKLT